MKKTKSDHQAIQARRGEEGDQTRAGVTGMTVLEVKGSGARRGHTEIYRGGGVRGRLHPKVKIEAAVNAELVPRWSRRILTAARTGRSATEDLRLRPRGGVRIRPGNGGRKPYNSGRRGANAVYYGDGSEGAIPFPFLHLPRPNAFSTGVCTATVEVWSGSGRRLHVPLSQTCCGQPAFNSGNRKEASAIGPGGGGSFLRLLSPTRSHRTPSGSCAAMVKHGLPRPVPGRATRIAHPRRSVGERIFELSQYLVDVSA